ncbi:MAG: hypothetical protein ABSF10_01975 [Verrucomicrobiota bacterium]|jgi:hypothetical protein
MKDDDKPKRVRVMIVGFDGSKWQYLDSVVNGLAQYQGRYLRLKHNTFLIDEIEGNPGYLNVVQLCSNFKIPLLVFDLADSEIEISPNQELENWLIQRKYRLKKLRA